MSESVINKQTEENIKNYLGNKQEGKVSPDVENIFSESSKKNDGRRKMLISAVIVFIAAIVAAAYFSFYSGQTSFDEKQVVVSIKPSEEISNGEGFMEISYENNNKVEIADAKISLSVPSGFIFISSEPRPKEEKSVLSWNVEKVSNGRSGKIKLRGKLVGEKDSEHKFALEMTYRPSNINYEYKSKAEALVKIASIPFEFSVKSKDSINNGDEIEYSIHYKNVSSKKFSAIEIKALLPDGFEYKLSEPEAGGLKENALVWNVKDVEASSEGNFTVKGNLKGAKDEEKKTEAILSVLENGTMFKYDSEETTVKISEIPIVLSQTVNGESDMAADKDNELEYKIKFKNISEGEIKGLIINSELEGSYDLTSIAVKNGSFDGKNKITWSAFNVPKLAALGAGEEDEVSFKVKVNDIFKIGGPADKNFVLRNKASIKIFNYNSGSNEIGKTIATDESDVKVRSFPVIKQTAYFNDDMRIPNFGLIPPEVGEETSYTVHWNLSNLFNDISNVKVSTVLPGHIRWTGNYITSDGKVSLGDENNGSNMAQSIDPMTLGDINGGLLENGLGVSYRFALPAGFLAGDELEFDYSDGNLNEKGNCVITQNTMYGYYYCEVLWKVKLPAYGEKKNYKINRALLKLEKEDLYYNAITREIVWVIPKAEANMGIISAAKEIVFQVGVTPQDSDAGNSIMVVDKVSVSGYDEFTLSGVSNVDGEIRSDLPDDESIGSQEGIVADAGVDLSADNEVGSPAE